MDFGRRSTVESSGGELLQELEALRKALYLNDTSNLPNRSVSTGKTHQRYSQSVDFSELRKNEVVKEVPSKSKKLSTLQHEKRSLWNWNPLRSLSSIRHRQFFCWFSLNVHSVEGLPTNFNGRSLSVSWRRKDGAVQTTKMSKVVHGVCSFGESLSSKCYVHANSTGQNQTAKYEVKQFVVYVNVTGAPDYDLGKHRIDLSRLLPCTLEALEEEKSGSSVTYFRLSGKAKGAILIATLGFSLPGDESCLSNGETKKSDLSLAKAKSSIGRTLMKPATPEKSRECVKNALDLQEEAPNLLLRHESVPESPYVLNGESRVQDKEKYDDSSQSPDSVKSAADMNIVGKKGDDAMDDEEVAIDDGRDEDDNVPFSVIEQGVEISSSSQESINNVDEINSDNAALIDDDSKPNHDSISCTPLGDGSTSDDLEEVAHGLWQGDSVLDDGKDDHSELFADEAAFDELSIAFGDQLEISDNHMEQESMEVEGTVVSGCSSGESDDSTPCKVGKSNSFDALAESVANEFLDMLGIEHSPFAFGSESEPESPREQLLRHFEMESLANGTLFGPDLWGEEVDGSMEEYPFCEDDLEAEDLELASFVHAAEEEHQKATISMRSKVKAKELEGHETEVLMREWGLNEKAFVGSPPRSSGGFGSPIHLPPEQPLELPPLGEGLGALVQTRGGGFVRSMNPSLFMNAKNKASLIMQVSSPVVVPAEMGSNLMEILNGLASVGVEKLTMQARKLMPLEDITGKTMHQVAWEADPSTKMIDRDGLFEHRSTQQDPERENDIPGKKKKHADKRKSAFGDEIFDYVSLEDLAPLAMDKIEALSIEGLKIQSGMADEATPSNVQARSFHDVSGYEGRRDKISGSLGLEGSAGLQLVDMEDNGDPVDGLMGLSITLDEWMKLDAGIVNEEETDSGRTSKILAAHHANCSELVSSGSTGEKGKGKSSSRRWGMLGNTLTVALLVQLRDPLRNYEPVGTPMLALIQAERVVVPPKPRFYCTVSSAGNSEEVEEEPVLKLQEEAKDEEAVSQFKITEIHVAGLKTETDKVKEKIEWGTTNQQQSGSRWLLASGMGKTSKNPFLKLTNSQPQKMGLSMKGGDSDDLWSISSRVNGFGSKWGSLSSSLNSSHTRNPNVKFRK